MAPGRLNIKIEQARISRVPVNSTVHLGDNLKWDPVNKVALSVVAGDAGSAVAAGNYLGVSLDENPINSLNQNLPFLQLNVCIKGMVLFTVDDNSSYYPGDEVTFGAGPQLVRHTGASGGFGIGTVAAENNFSNVAGVVQPIVAAAGVTQLLIWIKPTFVSLNSQN
jgi:hypothetical protein